jgi:hypothetical protein
MKLLNLHIPLPVLFIIIVFLGLSLLFLLLCPAHPSTPKTNSFNLFSSNFSALSDSLQKLPQQKNTEKLKEKKELKENYPFYYWNRNYWNKKEEYQQLKEERSKIRFVNDKGTSQWFLFYLDFSLTLTKLYVCANIL